MPNNRIPPQGTNNIPLHRLVLDSKKYGVWEAVSTGAGLDGMFYGNFATISAPTQVKTIDSNGMYAKITTAATTGSTAGWTTGTIVERSLNPIFRCKFRLNTLVHCRLWLGFGNKAALPNTADGYANDWAVTLHFEDNESGGNWKILHNNGAANSTIVDFGTPIAADTNIHTVEVVGNEAQAKWSVKLDNGPSTDVITNIPVTTTDLRAVVCASAAENIAKNIDYFRVVVVSDK